MGKPVVAIVGRPNVGKSTLFNKLAGRRIAIVEDTPGVTRDRIYADAEWLNYKYTLIDTGGIEKIDENIIKKQMRRQAEIAIETANVIVFIVDGKEGITPADREVAQLLRVSKKPIVLAVNKLDNLKDEANLYEFFNLGIGNPISISASQGLGLGELLDDITKDFDKVDDEADAEYIKVAIVGKPNVGKSSLINLLIGEERHIVSDIPGTTRDSVDSYLNTESGKFLLIDTAGLRRKSKVKEGIERYSVIRTLASVERCDVCILMVDATEGITDQDEKIIGFAHERNKAIMIVVNKWDLIEKDDKTLIKMQKEMMKSLNFMTYAPYIFVSALTGQRTTKILELASDCYANYSKRISTGILNDVISRALEIKEPPVVGLKRLKVYYVTQPMAKPPTFIFFVNDQEAIHFSYQRYLENTLRDNFDFKGTGIKVEFREKK